MLSMLMLRQKFYNNILSTQFWNIQLYDQMWIIKVSQNRGFREISDQDDPWLSGFIVLVFKVRFLSIALLLLPIRVRLLLRYPVLSTPVNVKWIYSSDLQLMWHGKFRHGAASTQYWWNMIDKIQNQHSFYEAYLLRRPMTFSEMNIWQYLAIFGS